MNNPCQHVPIGLQLPQTAPRLGKRSCEHRITPKLRWSMISRTVDRLFWKLIQHVFFMHCGDISFICVYFPQIKWVESFQFYVKNERYCYFTVYIIRIFGNSHLACYSRFHNCSRTPHAFVSFCSPTKIKVSYQSTCTRWIAVVSITSTRCATKCR